MRAVLDLVIVEILNDPRVSKGGIFLPENIEIRDSIGIVVAIGPDVHFVNIGEKVIYNNYSELIEHQDKKYRVVSEKNILCAVEVDGEVFLEQRNTTRGGKVSWEDLD